MPDQVLTLDCPSTSETGAYKLSWGPEGAEFVVSENGEVIYQGQDLATTLTGRAEGQYRYQVESEGLSPQSCEVAVDPPSLQLAFGLFSVGAVVFVATLLVIVIGHKRSEREE